MRHRKSRGPACDGGLKPTLRGLAVLLVLGLLAGCGKKGAPSAPGPAEEVKYPRSYPSR